MNDTQLPYKFVWRNEPWVVVDNPHEERGPRQCASCQYRVIRYQTGSIELACVPFVMSLPVDSLRCGPRNVVYIRDTEEGWSEYLKAKMTGGV